MIKKYKNYFAVGCFSVHKNLKERLRILISIELQAMYAFQSYPLKVSVKDSSERHIMPGYALI